MLSPSLRIEDFSFVGRNKRRSAYSWLLTLFTPPQTTIAFLKTRVDIMYKLAIAIIGAVALVSTPAFAGKSKQWNRGCEDAKRSYYDQDNHPQDYKDGNRACETAAAPADDGTPKDLKYLVNGRKRPARPSILSFSPVI
jgi:hypothetical protein